MIFQYVSGFQLFYLGVAIYVSCAVPSCAFQMIKSTEKIYKQNTFHFVATVG